MKQILLFCAFAFVVQLNAQQIIYDYETDETSLGFKYFGSSLGDVPLSTADNPDKSGNTSDKVLMYTRPAGSETWAGAVSTQTLISPVNAKVGGKICVDVHFDHIGSLSVKLEGSTTDDNWLTTVANTKVNEWETLCFDLDMNSQEDDMLPAAGHVYNAIVLFTDFLAPSGTEDVISYIDNINYEGEEVVSNMITIYDWETPETSTFYKYFGSTIDGDTVNVIANPDPTGVNMSPNVLEFVKPLGSESWAGAYASPAPANPIDVVAGGQVCVDVYFDHIGSIGIKLEASSTGGPNWLNLVENTEINTWQTLCVDVSNNGFEDPMLPAAGHVYGQLVLFTDFGTVHEVKNDTSYIDNIVLKVPEASINDVTFEVNMNNYTEAFTTVYLSGSFNSWSGDANPMTDEDADGIWTTTIAIENGAYEYKFSLDNWAASEQFDGSDVCTKTTINDDGRFVNRSVVVSGSTTVGPMCYESCYDCGGSVNITWNLNMSNETVSEAGVYVAGGAYFGHAELPSMTDEDGDGTYSITLEREMGFNTAYTFLNGICLPDWNCKEMIAGQDCAEGEFNDRFLDSVFADIVINTCFGECTTDGTCSDGPATFMATFNVDMSAETVGENGVFLSGALINGWSSDATPMTDEDADGIYSVTVELPSAIVEYKFVNSGAYEEFASEGECNITSGGFINRVLLMEEKDTVLVNYLFNSCSFSTAVEDLIFNETLFSINPNVANDFVRLSWNNAEKKTISVHTVNGQLISRNNISNFEMEKIINVQGMSPGVYFVRMDTPTSFGIKKMIITK